MGYFGDRGLQPRCSVVGGVRSLEIGGKVAEAYLSLRVPLQHGAAQTEPAIPTFSAVVVALFKS